MDFISEFNNAIITSKLSPSQQPDCFLGTTYTITENSIFFSPLFYILSGGTIHASAPYSFDMNELDCYMLLYSISGCGKLLVDNQSIPLAPSTLLLLDCHQHIRFDIAISPWEYRVAFFNGKNTSYYFDIFAPRKYMLCSISAYTDTQFALEKLLLQSKSTDKISALENSNLLNSILTQCATKHLSEQTPGSSLPDYLKNIRELFDTDFNRSYTLNDLETRFHINKYRLCREFTAAYGISPLQYLNKQRIDVARHLLLTTDLKVYHIGNKVGIENTNHFIALFKKHTGMTPLEYKLQSQK